MSDEPYRDPTVATDRRVADLLDRLTVAEKAAQLAGTSPEADAGGVDEAVEAVAEGEFGTVSPNSIAVRSGATAEDVAAFANRIQRAAIERSRLGVPVLTPMDATHGHAFVTGATVFPHGLGLAATREPALARRVAAATAREMRATGVVQNYAPTGDVAREPRWGRTYETYGESPHLTAEFVAAAVRGYQNDPDEPVAATVKHFPAYSEPSRGQDTAPVDRSPAHLRRVFLPPFRAAVGAGVDAVMPCYNAIDGVPVHASRRYLRDLLRAEFGSEGVVVSDWNGVAQLHEDHRVAANWEEAVASTVDAGLDVASIGDQEYAETLVDLVESGELGEDRLDESVRRILRLKVELGLFEDPYVDVEAAPEALGTDDHRDLALETARRSMTLLRNEDDFLPLDGDLDEVAVVGPNADDPAAQCGGWTADPAGVTTVRDGLEAAVGPKTTVRFEQGSTVRERVDVPAAADAAADADAAVVVLGEDAYLHEFVPGDFSRNHVGEFPNRHRFGLPDAQRALLEAVVETGTPTVLVLIAGRPLAIPWAAEHVDSILMAYYPGALGGRAVAETLLGECEPSGRLPISVPRSAGHLPTHHDHCPHPTPIGEWSHPPDYDPLFAFGHGLSYADFERSDPVVEPTTVAADGRVTVSVDVENVGRRSGRHVVDVFVRDEVSSRVTPVREWRGAAAVELEPGERETATVAIDVADLGVVHPDGRRPVEPGEFTAIVGDRTAGFEVSGD